MKFRDLDPSQNPAGLRILLAGTVAATALSLVGCSSEEKPPQGGATSSSQKVKADDNNEREHTSRQKEKTLSASDSQLKALEVYALSAFDADIQSFAERQAEEDNVGSSATYLFEVVATKHHDGEVIEQVRAVKFGPTIDETGASLWLRTEDFYRPKNPKLSGTDEDPTIGMPISEKYYEFSAASPEDAMATDISTIHAFVNEGKLQLSAFGGEVPMYLSLDDKTDNYVIYDIKRTENEITMAESGIFDKTEKKSCSI